MELFLFSITIIILVADRADEADLECVIFFQPN